VPQALAAGGRSRDLVDLDGVAAAREAQEAHGTLGAPVAVAVDEDANYSYLGAGFTQLGCWDNPCCDAEPKWVRWSPP
jgi:hypothetical protein